MCLTLCNTCCQLVKEETEKNKYIEFPYLDELNDSQLKKVKSLNRVYVDPKKRNLLYMMDDNGNFLRYSNKQRLRETKRLKYQRLIQNYKNKNGISLIENNPRSFNSKSCFLTKYKAYIKNKNKINKQLFEQYENEIFRKYKWYTYINTKRSEDNFLNRIAKTFGKKCQILYGKHETRIMRHFISTPGIGIKRKVAEKFDVYNLDEFRTSCLNHKTETKCENLYLPDKKNKLQKLHTVLTYKMENNRYGCIGWKLYQKSGINSTRLVAFINEHITNKFKNKLIILDNASSHRNAKTKATILKNNNLLYSVQYRHYTNSIETFFSILKSKLKKEDITNFADIKRIHFIYSLVNHKKIYTCVFISINTFYQ